MLLTFRVGSQTATSTVVTIGAIVHPEQVTISQIPRPDLDDADWFYRAKWPVESNVNPPQIFNVDNRSQRRGREFEATASLVFSETDSASAVNVSGGGLLLIGLH